MTTRNVTHRAPTAQADRRPAAETRAKTKPHLAPAPGPAANEPRTPSTAELQQALAILTRAIGKDGNVDALLEQIGAQSAQGITIANPAGALDAAGAGANAELTAGANAQLTAAASFSPHQKFRDVLREVNELTREAQAIPDRYHEALRTVFENDATGKISPSRAKAFNEQVRAFWPTVPEQFLAAEPGIGGQTNASELARIDEHLHYRGGKIYDLRLYDQAPAEQMLLPFMPKLHEAQKKLLMLAEHLKTAALPTPAEIETMKADAADPKTPLADVLSDLARLILDVESMIGASQVKRERLLADSETTSHTQTSTRGNKRGRSVEHSVQHRAILPDRRTTSVTDSEEHFTADSKSVTHSRTQSWWEELNWGARQYQVAVQTELDGGFEGHAISTHEIPLIIEKLLTARRLYEAVRERDAESESVADLKNALQKYMNDTKLAFVDEHGEELAAINLGSIRADAQKLVAEGWYPEERVAYFDRERSSRSGEQRARLGGLAAFSGGGRDASVLIEAAARDNVARTEARGALARELDAVSVEIKPADVNKLLSDARRRRLEEKVNAFHGQVGVLFGSSAAFSPQTCAGELAYTLRSLPAVVEETRASGLTKQHELARLILAVSTMPEYATLARTIPREVNKMTRELSCALRDAVHDGYEQFYLDFGKNLIRDLMWRLLEGTRKSLEEQGGKQAERAGLGDAIRGWLPSFRKSAPIDPDAPKPGTDAAADARFIVLTIVQKLMRATHPTIAGRLHEELEKGDFASTPRSDEAKLRLQEIYAQALELTAGTPPDRELDGRDEFLRRC